MTFKKAQILTLATFVVLTASAFGATRIFAQEGGDHLVLFQGGRAEHMSSLVQRIADKFGLDKDEVQAVFDEEQKVVVSQMEATYEERLSQLVKDGKITEEQKALIREKQAELRNGMEEEWEEMKDLSPEERRAQMQAKHDELKAWADENDIDPQYLMFGMKMHKGHGGRMMVQTSNDSEEAFEVRLQ
jgi:hypothetical protein